MRVFQTSYQFKCISISWWNKRFTACLVYISKSTKVMQCIIDMVLEHTVTML